MNKDAFVKLYLPKIEACLSELLSLPNKEPNKLYEAARYATLSPGKRLRPLLLLATISTFDGIVDLGLRPAAALELLHTYSLIHDDLPCMDDDDYRRGQLTLHKKFDEATAVLTGDFLLTYPFQIIATSEGLSSDQKIQMIEVLAKRAGASGMILGQMLDLEAETTPINLEQLQGIHQKKTGELLKSALEMGGIIANVSSHYLTELSYLGDEIGLAFQIIDDVIDQTASVEKHGKSQSSDTLNGKTTYVSCLGIEEAKKAAFLLLTTALKRLDHFPKKDLLKALAESLVSRHF